MTTTITQTRNEVAMTITLNLINSGVPINTITIDKITDLVDKYDDAVAKDPTVISHGWDGDEYTFVSEISENMLEQSLDRLVNTDIIKEVSGTSVKDISGQYLTLFEDSKE